MDTSEFDYDDGLTITQRVLDDLKNELSQVRARLAVLTIENDQLKMHLETKKELLEASESERTVASTNLKEMEAECRFLKAQIAYMSLQESVETIAARKAAFDTPLRDSPVQKAPEPEPIHKGVAIVDVFPLFCCNSR
jgi:hypothetical protein